MSAATEDQVMRVHDMIVECVDKEPIEAVLWGVATVLVALIRASKSPEDCVRHFASILPYWVRDEALPDNKIVH